MHLRFSGTNRYEAVVRLLIEKGADKEAKDNDSWTPLHLAAKRGGGAVIRLLAIELGTNIESEDNDHWTSRYRGPANMHVAIVKLLIEAGANKEAKDKNYQTPRQLAEDGGRSPLQAHSHRSMFPTRLLSKAGS
ncbi:ankyrin repeat protein [Hyaloscypha sp. PMI_1271]|nr:ankyrin repeat protein [Hyaloscypha sp. PMI_1271]